MINVLTYIKYFQRLANRHPEINDFYVMDYNEPLAALRSGIKYPALILNSITGKYQEINADNVLVVSSCGFLIIDHLDNPDDFFNESLILDKTMRIGNDIITRMRGEMNNQEILLTWGGIGKFDLNTVKFEMMGPLFENDFGFNFTFNLKVPAYVDYDIFAQGMWQEARVIPGNDDYLKVPGM